MISKEAIQEILGIKEAVHLTPEEMADKLNITFYPFDEREVSKNVLQFRKQIESAFRRLKVNIVPYERALETVPMRKVLRRIRRIIFANFFHIFQIIFRKNPTEQVVPLSAVMNALQRKRIKRGISVVATGNYHTDNLPMGKTSSFVESSVITTLDFPQCINTETEFHEHFDTAMHLFAYHMTNIVLAVDDSKWLLYNFNASHPIYSLHTDFEKNILHALIPKIVAPIRPCRFSEFIVEHSPFDTQDDIHKPLVEDLIKAGQSLEKTGLYPKGKKIDDLPFRNSFYRWIGKIHLDNRNGMSYGFLARQLPITLARVFSLKEAEEKYKTSYRPDKDYFSVGEKLFLIIELSNKEKICLSVPDVWVITQRSGSDKTHVNPDRDLIKMGLVGGMMRLQAPKSFRLTSDYKTSFDTRVILAHAVGNAVIASVLNFLDSRAPFVEWAIKSGFAISHWHGYFNPNFVPLGWYVHGTANPHVACSSPQSAMYSLQGKFTAFFTALQKNEDYRGDIHIEPHHGTNITYPSLQEFARFLKENPTATTLGNKYLSLYNT